MRFPTKEKIYQIDGDVWGVMISWWGDDCYQATVFSDYKTKTVPLVLEEYTIEPAFKMFNKLRIENIGSFELFYMVVCGALRNAIRGGM